MNPRPISKPFIAGILISAWANRPLSLRSHCIKLPRPAGAPLIITSKTPPRESPSDFDFSIISFMSCWPVLPPIWTIELEKFIPNSERNFLQIAPTATLAAVSRADDLSSTSLKSFWLYFIAPARSACPGLSPVNGSSHFSRAKLGMRIEMGEPIVWLFLTPEIISALSGSIFILSPRPGPCWRFSRLEFMSLSLSGK